MQNKQLLLLLAAIIGLGPLTIDLYLPAFPEMKAFFHTDVSQIQLTLSGYLLGFGLFHLLCGPLSDAYGRRPVLITGLSLYTLVSILCALAQTIEQLVLLRFLQGVTACVAPVLARAVVRDVFSKNDAIKALATVSAIMSAAPVAAPTIGSILLEFGDWRWTFYALAVISVIIIIPVTFSLKETLPAPQPFTARSISNNMLTLLKDPVYMGSVMTGSFLFAPLFAFLSIAAFIIIDFYGVPRLLFGAYFMFIVFGFILGNFITARTAHTLSWQKSFIMGVLVALLASVLLIVGTRIWHNPLAIVLPMLLLAFTIGLVSPKSMGLALQNYPHIAATASALLGFLQMVTAATTGWITGLLLGADPEPLGYVILGTVLLAACSCLWLLVITRSDGAEKEAHTESP